MRSPPPTLWEYPKDDSMKAGHPHERQAAKSVLHPKTNAYSEWLMTAGVERNRYVTQPSARGQAGSLTNKHGARRSCL